QPVAYSRPTADSRVAPAAWRETDHVWSPTMPSAVTAAHVWNASTALSVSGPKSPSMGPGETPPNWLEPLVRIVCRLATTGPVEPTSSKGIGAPSGSASHVSGP